jgi:hypothetical protein
MNENLYLKKIMCPVCGKNFEITKVKSKACKVASRDTDFCVYYEDLNPLFYDIWICEHCGYAAQSDKFEDINSKDAKLLKEKLAPRWAGRSFAGDRSIEMAIEAFKLALLNLQVRKGKASEFAKICIRLAWLYRIKEDQKELEFIKHALKYYSETYENERFPVDKLDECTCLYMIGELHRRAGNYEDAVKWLSRLISSPEARKNPVLIEAARDQYQLVKGKL